MARLSTKAVVCEVARRAAAVRVRMQLMMMWGKGRGRLPSWPMPMLSGAAYVWCVGSVSRQWQCAK